MRAAIRRACKVFQGQGATPSIVDNVDNCVIGQITQVDGTLSHPRPEVQPRTCNIARAGRLRLRRRHRDTQRSVGPHEIQQQAMAG